MNVRVAGVRDLIYKQQVRCARAKCNETAMFSGNDKTFVDTNVCTFGYAKPLLSGPNSNIS